MKNSGNRILKGIAAAPGIIIEQAVLYTKTIEDVSDGTVNNVEEALVRLDEALNKSKKELKKIFGLAVDKLGEKRAAIFEAQIMILDDPVLIDTIRTRIEKEKKLPEFIVFDEITKYQNLMSSSGEPYMKERSFDIEDIKNRIIRNIKQKKWISKVKSDVILVTESITPADAVLFSKSNVKGFITNFGGLTSHAAIVARSLNIPAVVGLHDATNQIENGDEIIIDGYHGEVILNPTDKQLSAYRDKIEQLNLYDIELAKLKDEPAVTTDGRELKIFANLDLVEEIDFIIQNGAQGIGLVRTEQIFQEYEVFPDEEEQFNSYKDLAEKLYPNEITIRTFDVGGDKVLPVDVKEPNPFLGWRGIRFLLDNISLFKSQIKAILRASTLKNLRIMLPMIGSIREIRDSHELINQCKQELKSSGIPFDEHIKVGIMIEIPSAAVMSREFSLEVDFMSIGTNDLIQYLLAVDRGNEIVSKQYQEFHPAVVRTLNHIVSEGKQSGIEVSICGEMAGDILAIPLLLGIGFDSISVSPAIIPVIKRIVRNINYENAAELVNQCLKLKTEKEIRERINTFLNTYCKEDTEKIL